jgi:DHA1 family inner membrane transport protein
MIALAAMMLWLPRTPRLDGNPIRQELSALRKWNIWVMMLVSAIGIASIFAVYTFIGPLVTDVAGLSPSIIPMAQVLYGAGMAAGTILGGRLADRFEFKGMVIGFMSTLCVLCIMALFAANAIVLLVTLFAVGFTMSVAIPTIPVRMTQMAPEAPTLMGAMNMAAFNGANAIGATVGGISITFGFGFLSAVWAGFILTALGLVIFGVFYRYLSSIK